MSIKLNGSTAGSVSLDAPASTTSSADITFKLPVADGSANQLLKTDGSGQLSFDSTNVAINSSGIVTKSNQPAFTATTNAEYNISSNNVLTYNNVQTNNGNHYNGSTATFTAPVTGIYYYAFDYYAQTNNTARAVLKKSTNNGSSFSTFRYGCRVSNPSNYVSASTVGVIALNANDQVRLEHEDGIVHINNPFNFFSMHLIG
tara:strand:- start:2251 stop:2856 length:606 start_codon:yes stop_codon:yes gene_type:complete